MKSTTTKRFKDTEKMRVWLEKFMSYEKALKTLSKKGKYIGGKLPYEITINI